MRSKNLAGSHSVSECPEAGWINIGESKSFLANIPDLYLKKENSKLIAIIIFIP